jgi:CheY-like chemotaxis protein
LRLVRSTMPSSLVLVVDLEERAPPVMADPVQLEQVLMNLCINARDAMSGRGTLEVRLRSVEARELVCSSCHTAASGRFVELVVADSGPGIPPAVLQRMFEPFYSTKGPGQGSGMGLATVHGIVHEHGGHVTVSNRPEGGAEFRMLFPALDPGTVLLGPGAPGTRSTRPGDAVLRGRVMLVEDDEQVRGFMSDLLREWGLEVAAYNDPLAARLAASEAAAPDVAVLDYTMPHMTGLELARALRARHPALPILLYTGYAEGLRDAELAEAGIRACLAKPVDTAQLFMRLEEILGRR